LKRSGESTTGVLTVAKLRRTPGYPSLARMRKGRVAVIECVEDIPCNPCEKACPFGAITVGHPITSLPVLHEDTCTGCGRCIPVCPGLAIFLVDMTYSPSEGTFSIPYEYLPLPEKDEKVDVLNRAGERTCTGTVLRVATARKHEGTAVVTVAVPRELCQEARHIRLRRKR